MTAPAEPLTIPDCISLIGACAFYACSNLTSVTIPETVMSIGRHAFTNCTGLANVFLPVGLDHIGDNAFQNCDHLRSVRYAGTKDQWDKIKMSSATREQLDTVLRFDGNKTDETGNPGCPEPEEYEGPGTKDAIRHLEKYLDDECYTKFHQDVCRLAIDALRDRQSKETARYAAVIQASSVRNAQYTIVRDADPMDDGAWQDHPEAEIFLGFFYGPNALMDAARANCMSPKNIRLIQLP